MNITVSKLMSSFLFISLPLFLLQATLQTAEAASTSKTASMKKNKKRHISCDSYSRSKLLKKANKYQKHITKAAQDYKVSPYLITAVITVESCFRPKARSSSGAAGLMQLMPATARRFGTTNRYNTKHNIKAGTKYLSFLLKKFNGNVLLTAAAYNAGEGAVSRFKGVPPYKETQQYVRKVLNAYRKLSKTPTATPKKNSANNQKLTTKNTRTRAWYIQRYKRQHTKSNRGLKLTTRELQHVNNLLGHENMQPALNFKQFL